MIPNRVKYPRTKEQTNTQCVSILVLLLYCASVCKTARRRKKKTTSTPKRSDHYLFVFHCHSKYIVCIYLYVLWFSIEIVLENLFNKIWTISIVLHCQDLSKLAGHVLSINSHAGLEHIPQSFLNQSRIEGRSVFCRLWSNGC